MAQAASMFGETFDRLANWIPLRVTRGVAAGIFAVLGALVVLNVGSAMRHDGDQGPRGMVVQLNGASSGRLATSPKKALVPPHPGLLKAPCMRGGFVT